MIDTKMIPQYAAAKEGFSLWKKSPLNPFSRKTPPGYSETPDHPSYYDNDIEGRLGQINLNKQGLEKFRGEALRTGPSAWAGLQTQAIRQDAQDARQQAMRDAMGQTANARTQLAMRGGLSGGARERLAKSGMRDYQLASQNLRGQTAKNLLDLQGRDEANRVNQLGALPGMELQSLQPDFQKTQMMADESERRNRFNLGKYQSDMSAWASNNLADRQAWTAQNTGGLFGKGGFLGLGSF